MNQVAIVGAPLRHFALAVVLGILSACSPDGSGAPLGSSAASSDAEDGSMGFAEQQPNISDSEPSQELGSNKAQDESPVVSTPLPLFGRKVEVPELFDRVDQAILAGAELYKPGEPLADITSSQLVELVGFTPMRVSTLPDVFAPESTEVFPDLRSVKQCFSQHGSRPGALPQVCIVQQPTPFRDAIGNEADVFQLETKNLYIEYVFGGWLGVGTSQDGVRSYQWDDRMVPVLRLRYFSDGLFTEISCAGHECPELGELVRIAETPESP